MTPPDKSLAERIEAIAAEEWLKRGYDLGLTTIAGELREIAGELRMSQGTGGFSGLTERFTFEVADRLAGRDR